MAAKFFKVTAENRKGIEWVNLDHIERVTLISTGPKTRGLEVWLASGRSISVLHAEECKALAKLLAPDAIADILASIPKDEK